MLTSVFADSPTPTLTILDLLSLYAQPARRQPLPSRLNPELRNLQLILSQPSRLQDFIQQTLPAELWEALPIPFRQRLFADFSMLGELDFTTLKRQYLAASGMAPAARNLMAALELKLIQLAVLFKQDPHLDFEQALHILAVSQPGNPADEALISQHWHLSCEWSQHAGMFLNCDDTTDGTSTEKGLRHDPT